MLLKIGDDAIPFVLKSSDKKDISLDDFSGENIVLLFFPLAFTSVCTEELCSVRDELSFYNDLNTKVLAISVDSLFTLAKYKEVQGFNFTFLSDFNKEVSQKYGALYEKFTYNMHGVSKRAAFIIDVNKKIRYAEILENAREVPTFAAIKETLQSLN